MGAAELGEEAPVLAPDAPERERALEGLPRWSRALVDDLDGMHEPSYMSFMVDDLAPGAPAPTEQCCRPLYSPAHAVTPDTLSHHR